MDTLRKQLTSGAAAQTDTAGVHFVRVCILGSLGGRQRLGRRRTVGVVVGSVEMGHFVQDTARHVVVIIEARGRLLGEVPEAVVWAWDDLIFCGSHCQCVDSAGGTGC